MTKHRKRARIGLYEHMKNNANIMNVLTAVYNGMASEGTEPIYSVVRKRTAGSKLHYFREDYPVVDPKLAVLTYATEHDEQMNMNLTGATDVIDHELEAARIQYGGLDFKLLGTASGVDEPMRSSKKTNLLFTRLTYKYQIQ